MKARVSQTSIGEAVLLLGTHSTYFGAYICYDRRASRCL